ncbi:DUF4181 domain-containing protein [Bacillus pinisoli]|uniref:DUF4181 domain-containing protein n=1 Tax=Bacillus pinisoli TaxID=2901866 RepID=UPI001FF274B3|nr:DUF4181 domain-containing protein [Bacillus pinisoli]
MEPNVLFFLIIVLILAFVAERVLRNKLNIKKREGEFLYKHTNRIHFWGEGFIVFLSLIILFLIAFILDNVMLQPYYFLACAIVIQVFRSIMEWKYRKESKQYIISIVTSFMFMVMFIGVEVISQM